jgi:hypothetical protein
MTRFLRSLLAKTDAWPPRVLLWVDLVIAGFVALAHGGALLAIRAHPTPDAPDIESLAMVSLPLAGLLLGSAVLGLAVAKVQRPVLALHGVVFLAAAIVEVVWGINLLVHGIPSGNFSWSVGLFSVSVVYAVFVFSRFTVSARLRASLPIYYSPVLALAVAVPIDIGVLVRFTHELNARFGS